MISKIFSLRNYVMKQLMKITDEGIMKIPDKGKVDFGEMLIKEELFKKGIDPKVITSERQLDNILNTPTITPHSPPKKSGEVINVDFDKGRWKDIDPEDFAQGGIAGLGERTGFKRGTKPKKKKKFRMPPPSWMMEPRGYRKVYESLEDIPEEALALMKKDPNFDLQTFLETVKWSGPEKTRFKKIKKHGKYSEDDIPWGTASPWGQYLNYLPFGEKESIGDGLLGLKTPSDMDKVATVMHEMRHSKMKEPWFAKSSAVPKWVQEYEEKGLPHYLDKDIKDKHSQYRDTQKDVSGEELYTRFLDQHFYPDAAKKGELAGSDYEPYFDKILKDKWASNLKAYKDILKEEKRVKSKPYGLAGGGRPGTGLNYLLGEDDQNTRVPFKKGHSAGRRKFLKGIAALAAIPIVGKYFKWAKPLAKSSKVLTQVPIKNISGMPAWFKPLVNRVIKEGDDVSYGELERVIVHQSKLPNSKTPIHVTQDLNTGNVRVDIGVTKHGFPDGHLGQPVALEYRAGEVIEPIIKKGKEIKGTKTKDEFWVEEAEFTGGHPENIKFEESTINKFGEHGSDFSEVEKFATGKVTKAGTKRFIGKPDPGSSLKDDLDFASGGRVPLGKGKIVKGIMSLGKKKKIDDLGGSKADPFSPDFDMRAEADLIAKTPFKLEELKHLFGGQIDDNIIREIAAMDPAKQLKAIEDVKLYLRNMKNLRQEKTLREFDIKGKKGHAEGGRVSRWMGGGLTKGKRTLSELLKYMSKGSSHGQTPSEMLKMINPKQFNEMLNKPEGIPSIAKEMIEKYTKEMKIDRADMVQYLIGTGRKMKKVDDDIAKYKMKIIEDMMSKGTDRATAEQMAETILMMVKQGAGKKATPKITDQGLLEMENIQKNLATKDRPLNAEGGRVPRSSGLAGMLGE